MSAFLCGPRHLSALVTAMDLLPRDSRIDRRVPEFIRPETHRAHPGAALARLLFAELLATNLDSLGARYEDTADATGRSTVDAWWHGGPFAFDPTARYGSVVEALKGIDCYEYQACEHEGWRTSGAAAYCDLLRARLITMLPGYEEAAWGGPAEAA